MVFFFVLFAVGGEQKVLGQDARFELSVDITEVQSNSGIYKIHLAPSGQVAWSGALIEVNLKFEYFTASDPTTPVFAYTVTDSDAKKPRFYSNESFGSHRAWVATNFTYDYTVSAPCGINLANIQNVKITSNLSTIGPTNDLQLGNISYIVHYPNNTSQSFPEMINDVFFNWWDPYPYTIQPISVQSSALSVLPLQTTLGNYYCGNPTQLFYAVAYGGCPPYTYNWSYNNGSNISAPAYTITNEWGNAVLLNQIYSTDLTADNVRATSFEAGSGLSYPYTVTITDANGNSITASNTYTDTPPIQADMSVLYNNLISNYNFNGSGAKAALLKSQLYNIFGEQWINGTVSIPGAINSGNYYVFCTTGTYNINVIDYNTECVYNFSFTITDQHLGIENAANFTSGTITGNRYFYGDITVTAGNTLTITNATINFVTPAAKILVQQGGKLIVSNSTLDANRGCGSVPYYYWTGIQAIGSELVLPPNFDPITQTDPLHGIVVMSGSTIKHAKIGLSNTTYPSSIGNAIVIANGCTFEDNDIGVYLAKSGAGNTFSGNPFCKIAGCFFNNTTDYFGADNLLGRPVGIVLQKANYLKDFLANTFDDQIGTPTGNVNNKGIGMVIYNAQLNVINSQFNNLYKGIDYYSLPTLQARFYAYNNNFNRTHRGITLNGGVAAKLLSNDFNTLGVYAIATNTASYGIFADAAIGARIKGNTFVSISNTPQNYNEFRSYGVILRNTGSNNYETTLKDNAFSGGLAVANNFDGDNNNMLIDCNTYANNILWDWSINNLSNTTNTLENQGACPIPGQTPDPALARRNSFHNTTLTNVGTVPSLHIVSGLTGAFEYRAQSDAFKPTTNVGSIISQICPFPVGTIIESQCAADNTPPDPDGLRMAIDNTTDPREKVSKYTDLIHARLDLNQTNEAKADLEEEARTISNKVLAATYYDEGDLLKAADYLAQIPLSDPENEEFYNLFMQLMGNNGGRIDMTTLNNLAKQQSRSGSVLAQTVIAERNNVLFDKNIALPKLLPNATNAVAANSLFRLYPNPANSQVQVELQQIPKNAYLQLYNVQGSLLHSIPITQQTLSINTNGYPTGIYYCKLIDNEHTIATQKIVIIR
jgi:hypothetical protein